MRGEIMTNYDNDVPYSTLAKEILKIVSSKSKKNHKDILDNIEKNKENFLSNLQQIIKTLPLFIMKKYLCLKKYQNLRCGETI